MGMFDRFSHYLSYGATDQQTIRDVSEDFNGLIVPGTIAAYQREGTGGFVLTLSATTNAPPYVIDPRFPLFQQALPSPKKSHLALAEILGDADLVGLTRPSADAFSKQRIESIAGSWLDFNLSYRQQASGKFEKYARRLGEPVEVPNTQAPEWILPPYAIASGVEDMWWRVSKQFFEVSERNNHAVHLARVVAARDVGSLRPLLVDVGDSENVVVWVSGLDELRVDSFTLSEYLQIVSEAASRGIALFSLYGGFFSVVAGAFGLRGASHGIGFGESRNWMELPQSGPPPSRYYLARAHRYVRQDFAQAIYAIDPDLARCPCPECDGTPPITLEYHSLMKHSVHCRAREIEEYRDLSSSQALDHIQLDLDAFRDFVDSDQVPPYIATQVERSTEHLQRWVGGLAGAIAASS
jgi:hypothetical protein